MRQTLGVRWKIYFLLYAPLIINHLLASFLSSSENYTYYHILISFEKNYYLVYVLNILSDITECVSLIPLFGFIFRARILNPRIWQWVFYARVILDITGHFYEWNILRAFLHNERLIALAGFGISAALLIPSYIAHFLYAFKQNYLTGFKD